ncbi:hypothetical protein GV828_07560 [Flavobacterium sp. NST-5]|uniref:Lipoprotein n=1 Tax=Flavobacterium ichthyis TaxID=2698827 RepID=A0ABW9ZD88_9FLAO|nr:hypothetical protein [Flavobacterium ichthyis]NBL65055.1 hypothetical protein [Flavobacterium ichthyis]
MKIITAIFLVLMMTKGCNSSELQKESENISFEYEASTRGNYFKTLVKQDTVFNIKGRNQVAELKDLPKKNWNSVLKKLSDVNVAKLNNLKAPSEKRFYDGAMMATFKVIYKNETYQVPVFDHGNPPKEIEKLVNEVLKVSQIQNKNNDD